MTQKKSGFNWRGFTSLILTLSALVATVSGILLYVVPEGRVAYWNHWSFWGLTKEQWGSMHTITSFLFFIAAIFHLVYNWKVLMHYLKDRVKRTFTLGKELVAALILTLVITHGSFALYQPFAAIMDFGEWSKSAWYAGEDVDPPYGHAELSTLKQLARRIGFNAQAGLQILQDKGIEVQSTDEVMGDIARANGTSPAKLYEMIMLDDRAFR